MTQTKKPATPAQPTRIQVTFREINSTKETQTFSIYRVRMEGAWKVVREALRKEFPRCFEKDL